MPFLSIPLEVKKKGFAREKSLKKSLDESLYMLLTTPRYNNVSDPEYGFIFNNMRFEIFDEHEGVIYNSGDTIYDRGFKDIYSKKRLSDIAVTMTYIREERLIYVTIKGVIILTKEDYVFTSTLRVWK